MQGQQPVLAREAIPSYPALNVGKGIMVFAIKSLVLVIGVAKWVTWLKIALPLLKAIVKLQLAQQHQLLHRNPIPKLSERSL